MAKQKTMIQQIKEKMRTASIVEAFSLRSFFLDLAGSRSSKRNRQGEAYAKRVEKYGEKRFGKDWWR